MAEASRAVFLSYASQDAEAARRICEALRTAGIEVWFDQSELRGGDVWDRQIRRQIHDCALFVPIISAHSDDRTEGYFRLEWKLAVDRSHLMADDATFLLPVVIDDTPDATARVPDKFRTVQWSRLLTGTASPAFVERVSRLLSPGQAPSVPTRPPVGAAPMRLRSTPGALSRWKRPAVLLIATVAVLGVGYFAVDRFWPSRRAAVPVSAPVAQSVLPAQSTITEKSIAVLPFVDMSEKHDQEYFSDGLSEELIDMLSRIRDLRVPARTSSFYFKGKTENIATIAQELGVAHLLEGSVRRSGNRLRVTAQLIRADSGYHLWSETYDRELTDIFKVQDEIATAVVAAMLSKLSLTLVVPDARRTTNLEAYDQYLLGRSFYERGSIENFQRAVDALRKSVTLDSDFAPAYAELGVSEVALASNFREIRLAQADVDRALADINRAITLAPNLADGYSARGNLRMEHLLDIRGAESDLSRALSLEPSNSVHLRRYAQVLYYLGRYPEALGRARLAVQLDPLDMYAYVLLGWTLQANQQYAKARSAYDRASQINPPAPPWISFDYFLLDLYEGRMEEALAIARQLPYGADRLSGLAMAEYSLGHAHESRQTLDELIRQFGSNEPFKVAATYAWRREKEQALKWLEQAVEQRDPAVINLKSEVFVGLHDDARFKALLRKINLPQ